MLTVSALLLLQSTQLSPFEMKKAETLLRDKLPCLGCHEVGGDGGRIGPSLSDLPSRRTAEFVRAVIADPGRAFPGTIMPKVPLPPPTRDLIARYLAQRQPSAATQRIVSSGPTGRDTSSAALYARTCAPCHGTRGGGDGPNARYLPVPPTRHDSAGYMSTRPDDVLYDAIAGGGLIMGRSNRMPPFGETLSVSQIRGLVRYLRVLCACEGPAWSRDGR